MAARRRKASMFVREAQAQGRSLEAEVNEFVGSALASSTRKGYTAAENLFVKIIFGEGAVGGEIYPLSGNLLLLYIYVMSKVGYAASTVRTYVAGLKTRNIENGHRLSRLACERARRAVRAAERHCSNTAISRGLLPPEKIVVRPSQLRAARRPGYSKNPHWVAMIACAFALLRARECLALRYGDVRFSTKAGMDVMTLMVRRSKCDQLGRGESLTVGCAKRSARRPCGDALCPVHNMYQYLQQGLSRGYLTSEKEALIFTAPAGSGEGL
ncbi:hypothetical protein FOZ62_030718, partial [Perkinsus olseni]